MSDPRNGSLTSPVLRQNTSESTMLLTPRALQAVTVYRTIDSLVPTYSVVNGPTKQWWGIRDPVPYLLQLYSTNILQVRTYIISKSKQIYLQCKN